MKAVYIFGSWARGEAGPESDIDIAVHVEASDGENFAEWIFSGDKWESELNLLLPVKVDLDLANPDISSDIVGPAIAREGIMVYPIADREIPEHK